MKGLKIFQYIGPMGSGKSFAASYFNCFVKSYYATFPIGNEIRTDIAGMGRNLTRLQQQDVYLSIISQQAEGHRYYPLQIINKIREEETEMQQTVENIIIEGARYPDHISVIQSFAKERGALYIPVVFTASENVRFDRVKKRQQEEGRIEAVNDKDLRRAMKRDLQEVRSCIEFLRQQSIQAITIDNNYSLGELERQILVLLVDIYIKSEGVPLMTEWTSPGRKAKER